MVLLFCVALFLCERLIVLGKFSAKVWAKLWVGVSAKVRARFSTQTSRGATASDAPPSRSTTGNLATAIAATSTATNLGFFAGFRASLLLASVLLTPMTIATASTLFSFEQPLVVIYALLLLFPLALFFQLLEGWTVLSSPSSTGIARWSSSLSSSWSSSLSSDYEQRRKPRSTSPASFSLASFSPASLVANSSLLRMSVVLFASSFLLSLLFELLPSAAEAFFQQAVRLLVAVQSDFSDASGAWLTEVPLGLSLRQAVLVITLFLLTVLGFPLLFARPLRVITLLLCLLLPLALAFYGTLCFLMLQQSLAYSERLGSSLDSLSDLWSLLLLSLRSGDASGFISGGFASTSLASTSLASTSLASTSLASTSLASTSLASTGFASTGFASTGFASFLLIFRPAFGFFALAYVANLTVLAPSVAGSSSIRPAARARFFQVFTITSTITSLLASLISSFVTFVGRRFFRRTFLSRGFLSQGLLSQGLLSQGLLSQGLLSQDFLSRFFLDKRILCKWFSLFLLFALSLAVLFFVSLTMLPILATGTWALSGLGFSSLYGAFISLYPGESWLLASSLLLLSITTLLGLSALGLLALRLLSKDFTRYAVFLFLPLATWGAFSDYLSSHFSELGFFNQLDFFLRSLGVLGMSISALIFMLALSIMLCMRLFLRLRALDLRATFFGDATPRGT